MTAPTDDEIKTAVANLITSTKTMCKHYENAEYNEFLEALSAMSAAAKGFVVLLGAENITDAINKFVTHRLMAHPDIIELEACFEGFYAPIEEPGN